MTPPSPPPTSLRQESFDLNSVLRETAAAAASWSSKLKAGEFVPGQVLVKLQGQLAAADVEALAEQYEAKVLHHFDIPESMTQAIGGRLALLDVSQKMTTSQALAALERDGRVAYAEANDIVKAAAVPDDLQPEQWSLVNPSTSGVDIEAESAWNISTGNRNIDGPIVAILDTGAELVHPDLVKNLWFNPDETADDDQDQDGNGIVDDVHGVNFIADNGRPADDNGHGTHCAGIIAAEGDNNLGITGVNWEGRVMSLKFLGGGRTGSVSDAVKAFLYAADKGARITSNSWTGTRFNQALEDVMRASPCLHICAAGDEGQNNDSSPAYPANFRMPNLISVAATDRQDKLAPFSNRGGQSVHLAAPGVDIHSTLLEGRYGSMSGTSQAAPHVAGVAALIATKYPSADNETIKNRILHGVDPLPRYHDRLISGGRLNAAKALENDTVAPARPGNATASEIAPSTVEFNWTAPGDDGNQGRAVAYEIRYSTRPITTGDAQEGEIPFDEAIPVAAPNPSEAGAAESIRLKLPPSGQERHLHFAVRAIDNTGNRSEPALASTAIAPVPVVFEDNVDGVETPWASTGDWGRVESAGRGLVWSDSPDADYGPNRNDTLTSPTLSLSEVKEARLNFDARVDTEAGYDRCHVEVLGKRWWRTRWRTEARLEGLADWKNFEVDLSKYDGQDIKLRFRFESDDSRSGYGVELDNIVVLGDPEAPATAEK